MGRDRNVRGQNSIIDPNRAGRAPTEGITTLPSHQILPGRKEEGQRDSDEEQQKDEQKEQTAGPVTTASVNRIERALIHLDFLEQEIKGLVAHGSELLGPMRRGALVIKEQFDGPVHKWPPLAKIRALLLIVKGQQ